MSDELTVCLAALFLNKGRDVLTAKEFAMYVSLDLRWMQVRDANMLMDTSVAAGLLSRNGEYLRPLIDIASVEVPVAYRPSEHLIGNIREAASKKSVGTKVENGSEDILPRLIQEAIRIGMEKGAFISECNKICKRMNIDMEVAAIMILNGTGTAPAPFMDGVRASGLSS